MQATELDLDNFQLSLKSKDYHHHNQQLVNYLYKRFDHGQDQHFKAFY